MKANRMQKPMPKAARSADVAQVISQATSGEAGDAPAGRQHRRADREIDKHRAGEIERGEEVEIGGEPEMVGDAGRDQPADQIAGDVAGDVGGEGARRHRVALHSSPR